MIAKNNSDERRKHNRIIIKEDAFVEFYKPRLFKLGKPHIVKSASIIDISTGGLAFQYIDRNMWSSDLSELSISKTTDKIKIDEVRFKAVSDFSISRLSNSKFTRRRGVEFGKLTSTQKIQLIQLIQNQKIGDRRSGIERRRLPYTAHSPQLRSNKDRRGSHRIENYK